MSREVDPLMAECLEEAIELLELSPRFSSRYHKAGGIEVATIAVALYAERMRDPALGFMMIKPTTPSGGPSGDEESQLFNFGKRLLCVTADAIYQSDDAGATWETLVIQNNAIHPGM